MSTDGWKMGRWWRAVGPDGELWAESSDEEEVRRLARPTDTVQNLWEKHEREWRDAHVRPEMDDPYNEKEKFIIDAIWNGNGSRMASAIRKEANEMFPNMKTRFEP